MTEKTTKACIEQTIEGLNEIRVKVITDSIVMSVLAKCMAAGLSADMVRPHLPFLNKLAIVAAAYIAEEDFKGQELAKEVTEATGELVVRFKEELVK